MGFFKDKTILVTGGTLVEKLSEGFSNKSGKNDLRLTIDGFTKLTKS